MFLAEALSEFYPDLMDKRFVSRFAIFHQRYSTNTFPSWDLANLLEHWLTMAKLTQSKAI